MVLALTFLLLVSALGLVFWGTTQFLQAYLYNEPVEKIPLRSLVASLTVGGFLAFWAFVNTRASSENKYGTFFDFNPVGVKDVTAFEAVRRYPKRDEKGGFTAEGREETVPFKRKAGKQPEFADEAGNKFVLMNSRDSKPAYLTVAIIVDDDGRKARFNANLNPKDPNLYAGAGDVGNHQFDEQGGSRYLDGGSPSTVYAPSTSAVIGALLLNGLMFVAWFAAFWPVLRYTSGHALGLAVACGAATLLVLMPLLFRLNAPKPVAPPPPAVADAR